MHRRNRWTTQKYRNLDREWEERWRKLKETLPPYAPELPDPYLSPYEKPI